MLVLAFVLLFIWRHRRTRKRKSAAKNTATGGDEPQEKAQLHSDEYKPQREELEGSKASPRIREIAGLNELEHVRLSKTRSEMAANEVAGAEISSERTPLTDSSTVVGSSLRNEVRSSQQV